MDLDGKVAIVTGASRGIGRQIALELARRGMSVVVAARTVEPHKRLPGTIGETLAAIEEAGGRAVAVPTDVGRPEDLDALVAKTIDEFGRVDVLVNNAATTNGGSEPVDRYPREQWLWEFQTNVHAPFTLIGNVLPHMREIGGGIVVNITSGAGDLQPLTLDGGESPVRLGTLLGYRTTKAALNRMANTLAPDLYSDNVTVVNVDPGFTRTELVDMLAEQDLVDGDLAAPMDLTVDCVVEVLTSDNPLQYTGRILRAQARDLDA